MISIYVIIMKGNKSVSSVVAAMLAGGYQMGSNVIDKAKAYDSKFLEENKFLGKKLNIGKSITNAKEKILQFDSHYEISKKVQKAGNEAKQAFLTGVKKLGDVHFSIYFLMNSENGLETKTPKKKNLQNLRKRKRKSLLVANLFLRRINNYISRVLCSSKNQDV